MSNKKEKSQEPPKKSSKEAKKGTNKTQQTFLKNAAQGEQGISLQPVGSQATDPFAPQDSIPASKPESPQSTEPAQNTPQSKTQSGDKK